MAGSNLYKLSPSDFAFLYEECKLCYYLKVKHGIYQPSIPMPGIFSTINTQLQTPLVGKNLKTISKSLPDGIVERQEGWVQSKPVPGTKVFIKGKYDLLVRRPDKSYILVDLKISKPREDTIKKYKTQLSAYKFALENPASGRPVKITKFGLLIFYPDKVKFEKGTALFDFSPKWLEVKTDDKGFIKFAKEVEKLLSGPPPDEGSACKWCKYRHTGELISHLDGGQEEIPF